MGAIFHFHSILKESLYANSEDLYQTMRSMVFVLGLHRLHMCLIKGRYADMHLFGNFRAINGTCITDNDPKVERVSNEL